MTGIGVIAMRDGKPTRIEIEHLTTGELFEMLSRMTQPEIYSLIAGLTTQLRTVDRALAPVLTEIGSGKYPDLMILAMDAATAAAHAEGATDADMATLAALAAAAKPDPSRGQP